MKSGSFDPRKLMKLAITVMRDSVHEPRDDEKPPLKVGAVLYKPDGTIETACRGELRDGDHAEFTLLERKNRSCKLDGSKLFATLEPCAPGARSHPKLGCAERIVLARISEVWIGIEDPDPKVDRKGIQHLQNAGITVNMFDRDLQEVIREENKDFIADALERAAATKEKPEKVTLSELENQVEEADFKDFSRDALEGYRRKANIGDPVDSSAFQRRLLQLGLLEKINGQVAATGFGVLLFGKEPRLVRREAGLLGTIHYPNGTEEIREFDGPMVLIPALVEKWLQNKLPSTIDRSRVQREELPVLPFELVREAVVNALVHRDYDIRGAKCQIVVTQDTITVRSPGGPLEPITLEKLQRFSAPMLSRNPLLHYVFARMALAEERGLGMKTFQAIPEKFGLPLPTYSFDDPYLDLTLYRSQESVVRELPPEVRKTLKKGQKAGWEFLASRIKTTKTEYAKELGFDDRKAQRHLSKFVELGLLRRVGAGPSTRYEVVR